MRRVSAGGGWPAIRYVLRKARKSGGLLRMYRALRSRNACKTCALGMGGQRGGMVNEAGRFPEVCKKSVQAMAADMQGRIEDTFFERFSIAELAALSPRELEECGRLVTPLIAGPLDSHFHCAPWDEAIEALGKSVRDTDPARSFYYFSGRSSNEAAFLLQLAARLAGTNNITNCSYYCHQASGVGLASVTGSGAATVALEDLERCDLIMLIGCNPASNHPRLMRDLMQLRRRGGKVIVINPLRERGLERFKVPSDLRSMLRATKIADLYVQPHIGGDAALMQGIIKALEEMDALDRAFIADYADGFEAVEARAVATTWEMIEQESGVPRATIEDVAGCYAKSKGTIFCWAMGITHQLRGVESVQMIANTAIARGMLGRSGAGLLPLRGHSNVQGIGSVGVVPRLKDAAAAAIERELGVSLPDARGLDTMACIEAAGAGDMDLAVCLGGNLLSSNPDAAFVASAFAAINTVAYLSTTLNHGHVRGRGRTTIILPVLARDEEPQTTTQESMFSLVRFSDGGARRHDGPRSESTVIADLAVAAGIGGADWETLRDHDAIRALIAKATAGYEQLDASEGEFYVEGRRFHEPRFATASGRAMAQDVEAQGISAEEDQLRLMTVRSEGQFNTVIYEEEDLYRGQERRDVVLMHAADIARLGLEVDQRVTVRGEAGELSVLVRSGAIRPGNCMMYYPEANLLLGRRVDSQSRTPAFKGGLVEVLR